MTAASPMAEKTEIAQKLKIALDEARMSVMGVQILIGFQLNAVVHERFATIPAPSKILAGTALMFLVGALGLLIAPAANHRIAFAGEARRPLLVLTTRLVAVALFLFAIAFACDVFIALEQVAGRAWGMAAGGMTFVAALLAWYALHLVRTLVCLAAAVSQEAALEGGPDRWQYHRPEGREPWLG
jgi:hypothetical protein